MSTPFKRLSHPKHSSQYCWQSASSGSSQRVAASFTADDRSRFFTEMTCVNGDATFDIGDRNVGWTWVFDLTENKVQAERLRFFWQHAFWENLPLRQTLETGSIDDYQVFFILNFLFNI